MWSGGEAGDRGIPTKPTRSGRDVVEVSDKRVVVGMYETSHGAQVPRHVSHPDRIHRAVRNDQHQQSAEVNVVKSGGAEG